jgi:hypothetical protein
MCQLCRDQLLRIWQNKLADRPEHLARVAARKAINGNNDPPKEKDDAQPM